MSWEFVWSFLAVNNMGMLFQAANYVWFFLDAGFIFTYGVLFFGAKQFLSPQLTKRAVFVPMCLVIAAAAALVTWFMHAQGFDDAVGGRSAYLIQLSISFLYIPLMLRQTSLDHFSFTANWTRSSLGDGRVSRDHTHRLLLITIAPPRIVDAFHLLFLSAGGSGDRGPRDGGPELRVRCG